MSDMLALTAAYAPYIHAADDSSDWRGWSVPRRRLTEYLLCYSIEGEGYIVIDGRMLRIHERSGWLLPPGQLADIGSRRGNHQAWVSFDVIYHPRREHNPKAYAYDAELGRRRGWLQPAPPLVWGVDFPVLIPETLSPRMAHALPALVRRWRQGSSLAVLEATHQLSGLLLDLVRVCGASAIQESPNRSRPPHLRAHSCG